MTGKNFMSWINLDLPSFKLVGFYLTMFKAHFNNILNVDLRKCWSNLKSLKLISLSLKEHKRKRVRQKILISD